MTLWVQWQLNTDVSEAFPHFRTPRAGLYQNFGNADANLWLPENNDYFGPRRSLVSQLPAAAPLHARISPTFYCDGRFSISKYADYGIFALSEFQLNICEVNCENFVQINFER